jgi:hypothetical protein
METIVAQLVENRGDDQQAIPMAGPAMLMSDYPAYLRMLRRTTPTEFPSMATSLLCFLSKKCANLVKNATKAHTFGDLTC